MTTDWSGNLPGKRRLKILLICPDGAAEDLGNDLAAAGHLVFQAKQSDDAGRVLRSRPIQLILIEANAEPVLLDIASRLRDEPGRLSSRHTPVLLLSDQPVSQPWPEFIDGVLVKPIDDDELLETYLRLLFDSIHGVKRSGYMSTFCEIEAAIDRLGGDVELYKDLVDRFLDDSAGTRGRLETAIRHHDPAMLHSTAHSLKGLASSVGAKAAAATLAELEEKGAAKDLTSVNGTWARFQIDMERTAEELAPFHRRTAFTPLEQGFEHLT